MAGVRWTTYPTGTREDAEAFARKLQNQIGGRVVVAEYLGGIHAWAIDIYPPDRKEG